MAKTSNSYSTNAEPSMCALFITAQPPMQPPPLSPASPEVPLATSPRGERAPAVPEQEPVDLDDVSLQSVNDDMGRSQTR